MLKGRSFSIPSCHKNASQDSHKNVLQYNLFGLNKSTVEPPETKRPDPGVLAMEVAAL